MGFASAFLVLALVAAAPGDALGAASVSAQEQRTQAAPDQSSSQYHRHAVERSQWRPNARSTLSSRAQYCVAKASAFHGVNADILHAIILVESDGRPHVVRRNNNGTLDVGMAQINSVHFRELDRYGIQPGHLFDECVAAFVAGWHYARQVRRFGNNWMAVGAYHSRTPHLNDAYQRRVMRRLRTLGLG